ncbi:FIST signal transduction protein [Candidatus Nucleicultrix amoebiphila]|jgi:hypothetical protein|uniref:FIST N domain protein n=1 Tax=Candidatus Nucleicultrix amoebiphila FS5 TaxID=1414854 RepID=A0A1W6N2R2_9PROT|nr:FIST N-terminal domain-containing protein [Candidatus Nucleicultrix amoebiphila]ARN84164.1 hypothetical protein GQ61_01075 [Candidatus Nucleicultrix amoebiphila FS5]
MKLETIQYLDKKGWSVQTFPELDSENTLILIFSSPQFVNNAAPIQELVKHYPQSKIIGCSSAGEIAGAKINDNSLSVAIARFEKTKLQLAQYTIDVSIDSFKAGESLAKQLDKNDLKGIFVLSDGLNVNGSELARGLNTINKPEVTVTGGLAADGKNFVSTWTIYEGKIVQNQIVAVGLYGNSVQIAHASKGGWDIFGVERRITRSKNNVLYTLDNQPALQLYKEYLGERAAELPASGLLFPLAIREDADSSKQLVRTILSIDEKEQSLTFAGDMPNGYFAQLMRANFDRLITSASDAGEIANQRLFANDNHIKGPILAVAISCVGRRLVLGERTEEETESLLNNLPKNSQQVGFYSYGELSPHVMGTCDLHNQTMTLTIFSES